MAISTVTRDMRDFTRIDMRGAGNIHLTQGRDFSFEITAENHILDVITTQVEDDTLQIAFEEGTKHIQTQESITYTITMPIIGGVRISGGGSLDCERIAGKSFELDLPGGAKVKIGSIAVVDFHMLVPGGAKIEINTVQAASIKMDIPGSANMTIGRLDADDFQMNVRGTTNMTLKGRVITQTMNVLGVANIKARELQTDSASIKSLGMSNINVWVMDDLDVIVNGAGNVSYYGNPKVKKSINGFGRIKKAG